MKKIICMSLIALSSSAFAITAEEKATQEKENLKILAGMGLQTPNSGIQIVPRAMLHISQEVIAEGDKEQAEFKEKGFVNKYINRPHELMAIVPKTGTRSLRLASSNTPTYTGLYKDAHELKLAFKYPEIVKSKNKGLMARASNIKLLAATPTGAFHEDLGGWSGVAQFFSYNGIGTCDYTVINVMAASAAVRLAQEDVTYTINSKATLLLPVEGSDNSGFLYSVKWYDNDNFHELTCANKKYDADINDEVIKLAQNLDKK